MNARVQLELDEGIAVVTIVSPPVNALGHAVRAGLREALDKARSDQAAQAVVLIGEGRGLSGGADITEFDKPALSPTLPEVIEALEAIDKPTVAAIHGMALGGGLELALGCHFRVATADARLGLPEVRLGLLPGAGGTQRLPRLIGAAEALDMIAGGEPITAADAARKGLVDEVIEGDLRSGAVAFARRIATGAPPVKVRDRDDRIAALRDDPAAFEEAAAATLRRARGARAPAACVESVRNAFVLPFAEGLKRERALFDELREGDQSKAQRHLFFAERAAAKVSDLPAEVRPRTIRRAAVIGAGTMGGGIAMCFANAGIPVVIVESSPTALARGLGVIQKNYSRSASRGRLSRAELEQRLNLIEGATDINRVAQADIVVEAVFEEMGVKKEVFAALDATAPAHAVLATNTSYLDVDEIAAATNRPGAVLGMHFFSPANVMRLVEVVRAAATAPDVLATTIDLARRLGKSPVVVGVCHGFVGNRMLGARAIELERLLVEGALPQDVDRAIVDFGFPMGPFAMSDLAGLDIDWRMRRARGENAEIADMLCEAGRFGQKTGRGFYIYEVGSRAPKPDPEVAAMIEEASRRHGVARRGIEAGEIVERLIFPMINEGARILEEGIAQRPGDIDVVWVYGYGWPAWRGGPMYFADRAGLAHIRDRLAAIAARSEDPRLEPAQLLKSLAAEGKGFGAL